MSPTQTPSPDNAQLPQDRNIHASCGIRTPTPNKRVALDYHALDRAATGIG